MIILCDQVYFSLKNNTLSLQAFRSWNYTQTNCAFLSYHQALLWMHLGNSQASSKEDIKQRKNRACILYKVFNTQFVSLLGKDILKHLRHSCLISIGLSLSKAMLQAVQLILCLLWWSWLFSEGTAPSEAVLLLFMTNEASCCAGSRPRAFLVLPWQYTTPRNNKGMSIKQGCNTAELCSALLCRF